MTAKDPTHLIGRLTETARDALQRIVGQLEPLERRGELSNPLGGFIDTDLKFPPEFYSADAKGLLGASYGITNRALGFTGSQSRS